MIRLTFDGPSNTPREAKPAWGLWDSAPVIHLRGAVTPNTVATLVCSPAVKAVSLHFPILCCLYFPASLRHQAPRLHYNGYPLNSLSRPGGSSLGPGRRKTQTASHLTLLSAHTAHQALPSVSLHKSSLLFVTGSFFFKKNL